MRILAKLFIVFTLVFSIASFANDQGLLLKVNGLIRPATRNYIVSGLNQAAKEHAPFVVLDLNTTGGLENSMRSINAAILSSTVPVIAYIPENGETVNVGTFILYASHLSAMAQNAKLGTPLPTNHPLDLDNRNTQHASAYLKSLASLRDRPEWTHLAKMGVTSISADKAYSLKMIEVIADDYPSLLAKINGHTVNVAGTKETLATQSASLKVVPITWFYHFVDFITDPNIAYLLILIAIYGLFFELSNPGRIFPGVIGLIALLLALYAFRLMPMNYTGFTLLLVGIAFMIFEVYISTYGIVGLFGLIGFILGSILLFDIHEAHYHLSLILIIAMCIVSTTFFFMLLGLAIRSHKRLLAANEHNLIGSEGIVLNVMNEQVAVQVLGETWEAKCAQVLNRGDKVTVTKIDHLTLTVKPKIL